MLPTHACSACGICSKPNTFAEDVIDQRLETQSGQFQHRVLFVRNAPTPEEAKAGKLLVDPGVDWLLDYLAMSQFEWRVTAINKGYPGKQKDGKKDAKATVSQAGVCTDAFLVPLLKQFKPHVIVALGGEVLGHLWPKKRGEAPSIAKARMTPVQVAGMWLVSTYDPKMHGYWLQDDRKGSDLTEEYIRCFQQIHDLLDGTYRQAKVEWSMVDDLPGLQVLRDELDRLGVKRNYLDVEDDSWLGSKVRPHDIDPEGALPEKLTIYHPNNRLLVIGITAVVEDWITGKPAYKTYVILPGAWTPLGQDTGITDSARTVLIAIFQGRDVECWNTKYDVACLLHFTGIDLRWHKLGDGFLVHGLPDQTKTGNSLKLVAQTRAQAPAWDIDLDQQKDMIAKRLRSEGIPPLVSMGMMPVEVYAPYNANDTYWNAVLVEEKLSHDLVNNPDFPWVVHNMLLWGLPWLIEMERNGIPADEELFWDAIAAAQTRAKKLWDAFRTIPEVHRAEQVSNKEFNIRSPIFYEALVKELYGVAATEPPTPEEVAIGNTGYKLVIHVPPEFPRTDTGRLSSDKNTLQSMAGEVMGKVVPWEEKTRAQRLWTKVIEWRNLDDDATRLLGLFDYIVNDRIHSNFRILRSEVPGHEQGTQGGGETEGGTVSGRFCVAKGTFVEMPRDLGKHPSGVPIEDVREGDLVYSYDAEGTLSLQPVLWSGQTGVKPTVIIQWSGQGNKGKGGSLCLTPEHLVRLIDGSWKPAGMLVPGDRMMALSRGIGPYGYARLYACKGREIPNEHRFIAKQIMGSSRLEGMHTHHIDESKLNNSLKNLEVITPLDHARLHPPSEHTRALQGKHRGSDHHGYVAIPRFSLLRMLAQCAGGPKKTADVFGYDYSTIIARCEEHKVDWQAVVRRYDGDGCYLSPGRVKRALAVERQAQNDIQKDLKIGYYRVREIAEFYGLEPRNHRVIGVQPGPTVPVYDLEVANTHCFIAEELAIHNSTSPNIQNSWPRMRMLLRTKPGKVWVKGDYGRIELAWLAWNSQDPLFMQWAREELDQHWARGGALWGRVTGNPVDAFKDQDKATQKAWRSKGKTQNFATVYLEEARTTASKTGATVEEVIQELMLADELHPGIRQLKMEVFELCQAGKLIKTCFGRCRSAEGWRRTKLTAEQWVSPDPLMHQGRDHHNMTIYRSLWNTRAAQGDSSDTAFYMGAHIYRKINSGYWLHPAKVKPISFEHDCLCWEVDEDYLDEALPALYNEMRDLSILPIKFDLPLPVDMKYGRTPLELEQEDYHKYTPAVVADSLKGWSPNDV